MKVCIQNQLLNYIILFIDENPDIDIAELQEIYILLVIQ